MKRIALLATLLALVATAVVADEFGDHWYDGKAELDGYRLKVSRYGETRGGTAVMIFVTEPFSRSQRVKVDDYRKNPDDVVNVLKLNLVRDFQTGIYDYNTMVSVFSDVNTLEPLKVSFSSAEWCGHVYSELVYRDDIEGTVHSYFEGESAGFRLARPDGLVSEDNLFIILRGLRGDYLAPGESKRVKLLPSLFFSRLAHRPSAVTDATIARAAQGETATVPAGSFDTFRYDVTIGDRSGHFWIEAAWPHRIVRWELAPDVSGELLGSKRLEYWRLHAEGDEQHLKDIGLGAAP